MKFRFESLQDKLWCEYHSDFDEEALQILLDENLRLTIRELANRLEISHSVLY